MGKWGKALGGTKNENHLKKAILHLTIVDNCCYHGFILRPNWLKFCVEIANSIGKLREGVKNISRGMSLNLASEGRKVLTPPPKNAEMGPYPPKNVEVGLYPPKTSNIGLDTPIINENTVDSPPLKS